MNTIQVGEFTLIIENDAMTGISYTGEGVQTNIPGRCIYVLAQEIIKMRELLQAVSDCRGTMAEDEALNNVFEYTESLPR